MPVNSFVFRATFVISLIALAAVARPALSKTNLPDKQSSSSGKSAADARRYLQLPLSFVENRGQWNDKVKFRSDLGGASVWFTADQVIFQLSRKTPGSISQVDPLDPHSNNVFSKGDVTSRQILAYSVSIEGANSGAVAVGNDSQGGKINYLLGATQSSWRTDIPAYSAITYNEIYPGIDLIYRGSGDHLEYDFAVKPGVDPGQISLRFDGIRSLSVDRSGSLLVTTEWGTLIERPPVVTQRDNGVDREISSAYQIDGNNAVRFKLGKNYDPTLPTLIDPILSFSSLFGGSGDDYATGVALDTAGCVYLTGHTSSVDLPTVGAYDASNNGSYDIFVTKLSPTGSSIIYSTYIGGSGDDRASKIAVTAAGQATVAGYTLSTDFPTQSAIDNSANGLEDMVVLRLSAAGNSLAYSTYLGGSSEDRGFDIALDATGRAYVAGETNSTDIPTPSGYDMTKGSGFDAYVARLSANGSSLEYGTYLGGNSSEGALGIAVDNSNVAYVTGYTSSPDFPMASAYDPSHNFDYDVFVSKLSSSGGSLTYSTFLGGTGTEWATAIARDASNNMYITGLTTSNLFPTINAYDNSYSAIFDAFVTKIAASGSTLSFSTYLGSGGADEGLAISVDPLDQAVVVGFTNSSNFPTLDAVRPLYSGLEDMFVTKFKSAGNQLLYSTYLGGSDDDEALGVTCDETGNAIIAGFTVSSGFPLAAAMDSTVNGGVDVAFAKISDAGVSAHIALSQTSLSFDAEVNTALPAGKTFNISNSQSGSSTLKWYCVPDQSWINVSHDSGQTDFRTITVTMNSTGLSPGVHTGHVTISSPNADNSPQVVNITYEVWNPVYPIVMVHGMASDSLVWNTMKTSLASDGFDYIWRVALDACGATSESNYASSARWLYEGNAAKLATAVSTKFNALPANIKTRVRGYDFIGHGMGGLVIRRYLGKSDVDSWTPVIARRVIMLGTPNDGLGILGDKTKLYQCTGPVTSEQHSRRMIVFNSYYADISGVNYYSIYGSTGCSSSGIIQPGCGGWKKLASRFLECANDGSIPASSAVGQKDLYVDRYNKSYDAGVCYASLPTNSTVYTSLVRPILQGSAPAPGGDITPVQPQIGFQFDSTVSAGATASGSFPVESNSSMTIMLLASDPDVAFSITSPGSTVFDSTSTLPDSSVIFVTDSLGIRGLYIQSAASGTWQWTVNATNAASVVKFSIVQAIENSVKINRIQNLIYPLTGDTLRLLVRARSGGTPITGLTVSATPIYNDSTFGSSFNLLDNGASGDSANADGVYGKKIVSADSGLVRYNISVTGTGPLGTLSRKLSAAVYVSGTACKCGNIDGSFDGSIDIADLSRLIDYLYISFSPLGCRFAANVDGSLDGGVDIADLSTLIAFLYLSGPAPNCH